MQVGGGFTDLRRSWAAGVRRGELAKGNPRCLGRSLRWPGLAFGPLDPRYGMALTVLFVDGLVVHR